MNAHAATLTTVEKIFEPRRLGHANLAVSELQRSLKFYNEICGIDQAFAEPALGAGFLSNGNTHHDIAVVEVGAATWAPAWHPGRRSTPGLGHLGIEMPSEAKLVEGYNRALNAGIPLHRAIDHTLAHSIYLFDPEWNLLELYADVTFDWRGVFERSRTEVITGPWEPHDGNPLQEARFVEKPPIIRVADSALHVIRTESVTLIVQDLDRMARFYCRVVGLNGIAERHKGTVSLAGSCGTEMITLVERGSTDTRRGLHHIKFLVEKIDNPERTVRALVERGISAKRTGPDGSTIELQDPDGITLRFAATAVND